MAGPMSSAVQARPKEFSRDWIHWTFLSPLLKNGQTMKTTIVKKHPCLNELFYHTLCNLFFTLVISLLLITHVLMYQVYSFERVSGMVKLSNSKHANLSEQLIRWQALLQDSNPLEFYFFFKMCALGTFQMNWPQTLKKQQHDWQCYIPYCSMHTDEDSMVLSTGTNVPHLLGGYSLSSSPKWQVLDTSLTSIAQVCCILHPCTHSPR